MVHTKPHTKPDANSDTNPGTNPDPNLDPNLRAYNSPEIAGYYAALTYLTPCELLLFEEHLRPGMSILDLGVGGGRTTPHLSSTAGHYVGVDYAPEMIAACQKKFPQLRFEVGSATDLSRFASYSFHAVIMAFNAVDYIFPQTSRVRALHEIHRVLKPEGVLIFSSHNPRSIFVRASWNPKRVRDLAEALVGTDSVFFKSVLWSLACLRVIVACSQAAWKSLSRAAHKLPTQAFWRGRGFLMDSAHGGLKTFFAVPRKIAQELEPIGFQLLRILGDDYPRVSHLYSTDWYYYVFSKTETSGEK